MTKDRATNRESAVGRRLALSIAVTLFAGALIATFFRADVAAYVTRYAGQEDILGVKTIGGYVTELLANQSSRKSNLVAQGQVEADQASAPAEAKQAAQAQQIAAVPVAEAQRSLKEDRAEGSAQGPAEARRAIEGLDVQLQAEKSARSFEEDREKAVALALEAATARKELAASTEQHRQALEAERARGIALARALATAQRENEKQAGLLKAGDETGHRQTAESATTELRQHLRPERDTTKAMARDLEPARRTVGARTTPGPATSNLISRAAQTVEVAAAVQPAAAEAKGGPEATRLIARASVLLGQGDIGSARIVLERASETGSAKASFMLAETYDPAVLTAWGTYGTRGEVTKARELYARAHAGGILEAKN